MTAPELHPDFKDFLSLLRDHRVRFLIVGAHALAAVAFARATNDIDVLIEPTRANAKRLATVLREFGFHKYADAAEEHFSQPGRMATLGHEPLRIDLLSSIDGVTFRNAWRGRVSVEVAGLNLPFLGLAELVLSKRAAGRPKDLRDLEDLELRGLLEPTEAPPRRRGKKGK
jgi:predicted nucleotidyltransferase